MKKTINLIPADIQRLWRRRQWRKIMAAAAVAYLLVLAGIYADQRLEVREAKARADSLAAERAALAAKSTEYRRLTIRLGEIRKAEGELKTRVDAAMALAGGRLSWSRILRRLSNDVPPTVWLRALSTSDTENGRRKKMRFLGTAVTNTAIADFIFTLENSGYFGAVDLSYSQKREFHGETVYDFEVFALLKYGGEAGHEW